MRKERHSENILAFLQKNRGFNSAEKIAQEVNVSTKTIYRLVKEMNQTIPGEKVIFSEKGKGYALNYEVYLHHDFFWTDQKTDLSPEERREKLLKRLLFDAPYRISERELFANWYLSESTKSQDEKMMEQWLATLSLRLNKQNQQWWIEGEEQALRAALIRLVNQGHSLSDEHQLAEAFPTSNAFDRRFILKQLNVIEELTEAQLPHPYNVNLYSHLAILFIRVRKLGSKKIDQLWGEVGTVSASIDNGLMRVAKIVSEQIEDYLGTPIAAQECEALYHYLVSSRLDQTGKDWVLAPITPEVEEITASYIQKMQVVVDASALEQVAFAELAQHIKPMLNRLRHGILIQNQMLNQIKIEYSELFLAVTKASQEVAIDFSLPVISEDENGFLTIYFARMAEQFPHKLKVLIMCTTGIGTSELLRVKITQRFSKLEIVEVLSSQKFIQAKEEYAHVDLILSTIRLTEEVKTPVLVVSSMFTEEDQRRVEKQIGEVYREKYHQMADNPYS